MKRDEYGQTLIFLLSLYSLSPTFPLYHSFSLLMQGITELHRAAERGDVQAVQRLLNTSVNINSRTEDVRHILAGAS